MFALDDYIVRKRGRLQVHWAEKRSVNGQLTSTIVSIRTFGHDCAEVLSSIIIVEMVTDITVAVYSMKSRTEKHKCTKVTSPANLKAFSETHFFPF